MDQLATDHWKTSFRILINFSVFLCLSCSFGISMCQINAEMVDVFWTIAHQWVPGHCTVITKQCNRDNAAQFSTLCLKLQGCTLIKRQSRSVGAKLVETTQANRKVLTWCRGTKCPKEVSMLAHSMIMYLLCKHSIFPAACSETFLA